MSQPHPQINLRVPDEARDVVLRIGRLVRRNPSFIEILDEFARLHEGGAPVASLADRLDRLEQAVFPT